MGEYQSGNPGTPAASSARKMILLFMTTTLYSRTCARQPQSERMVVMLAPRTDRQNPALDACISSLVLGFATTFGTHR